MASIIKVDQIQGSSGNTVTIPSGTTLDISSATLADQSVALSSISRSGGSAGQFLRINTGGTGLEYATVSGGGSVILEISDGSTPDNVEIGTDTLTFTGGTGLTSAVTNNTVTFNIDSSVVTLTGSQVLSGKTLTSPTINTATADDLTITGTLTAGGGVGTSGQLLRSTGTGVEWATVSGGGGDVILTLADDTSTTVNLLVGTDTLSILGGTGLTSAISGDTITLNIDSTVATLTGSQTLENKTADDLVLTGTLTAGGGVGTSGQLLRSTGTGVEWATVSGGGGDVILTLSDDTSTTVDLLVGTDTLKIAGGTGLTSSISGDTITLNIDATVATLTGSETLENKTIDTATNTITIVEADISDLGSYITATSSDALTNKTFDANGTGNSLSNVEVADFASGVVDTNLISVSASDDTLASAKAIKSYVDSAVGGLSASLSIVDDTSTLASITLSEDTLKFAGGTGISTSLSGDTLSIAGDDATTSTKGIASFNTADFSVTSGDVTIKALGVSNAQLAGSIENAKLSNPNITIGSDTINLGATQTDLNGITSIDIDNITIDGNTISTTNTDGDLVLSPDGTGDIDANSHKIVNILDPVADQDAASKAYVDSVASGLDVKASVKYATIAALPSLVYNNGAGTLTASGNGALSVDSATPSVSDRILVKDQSSAFQNGIYVVTQTGDGGNPFILTRATDADTAAEITGGTFVFVESGTDNADNGYVFTHVGTPTLGTTNLNVSQFSGAGQITAGDGLDKSGNTLSVRVDNSTLAIVGDILEVAEIGNDKLTNSGFTIVDDTSTAGTISLGETLKIAGSGTVSTSISGDTITITGTSASFTYSKDTFTGNGSSTFTINSGRTADDILVVVNGLLLTPTDDYTVSGTTLSFTVAPTSGAEITVRYLAI